MRIAWLRLENYRRFDVAEVEFPDGVLGLVGPNGSGKSTLIEAVGWALYGHDAARTGKEHLRRAGARGDCRVALRFELGGEEYEVVRELAGKAQEHRATLKVGGKLLVAAGANSAKEATLAVERALRMDREAFFTSLVARQGELSALSDLSPARRKEVVLRMLRIDAIDRAIALAREERRRVEAQLEVLAGQRVDAAVLAQRQAALRAERADEEKALADALQGLGAIEASLEAVAKARERAEERRLGHDALAQREAVLRSQAEGARRAAEQASQQLADLALAEQELAALAPQAAEHPRVRAAVEALESLRLRHAERERHLAEAVEVERERQQAAERLGELLAEDAQAPLVKAEAERARAHRAAQEQALSEARSQAKALEQAVAEARDGLGATAARRGELESLGTHAPCPLCERPLADALPRLLARLDEDLGGQRARFEALQRRRTHAEGQAKALAEAVAMAQAREEALKRRLEQLARREAERDLLQRRAADLAARAQARREAARALGEGTFDEAAYARQRGSLLALARAHERALHLRGRLERRGALEAEREAAAAEQGRAAREAQAAAAERAALGHDPQAQRALEERFASLQARARAAAVELERRRLGVERLDAELQRCAQEEARLRALEATLGELRGEAVLLERLAGDRGNGLLAEFRSSLMGRIRPALAQRAGELFRTCTDGRYEGLELSEDYELQVLEGGQALPVARYSGGEADLANLCLRIAIGEVLAERSGEALGFLALDEVLGSQDEQRRANILQALARLRGRFRQILLITHIEEVKEGLEHVLRVDLGEDGSSRLGALEAPLAA